MADGLSLAKHLAIRDNPNGADRKTDPTGIVQRLKDYEREMLIRGTDGVLKSRDAAEDHQATDNVGTVADDEGKRDKAAWLANRIEKQVAGQGFKRT